MFEYDEELCVYKTEIDGVEFVCEEIDEDYEAEAKRLAKCYEDKKEDIVRVLVKEISKVCTDMTLEELLDALGKPTIDLDMYVLCYFDHILDGIEIIEIEFEGDFENLVYNECK